MKLRGFGIANFRSFDQNGVYFHELDRINILVGRNNSGKSNTLKFLSLVSRANGFNNIIDSHSRQGGNPALVVKYRIDELTQVERSRKSLRDANIHEIELRWEPNANQPPQLRTDMRKCDANTIRAIAKENGSSIQSGNPDHYVEELTTAMGRKAKAGFAEITKKLIYIPDFRRIAEGASPDPGVIDGRGVVSQLYDMQHPRPGEEARQLEFRKIEVLVRDMIGDEAVRLEIPNDKSGIIINLHGQRLPLSSFGAGIHELVMTCSAFAIYHGYTVCAEEPELHLHPTLQRKYLRFLADQTDNLYFLTTHSSTLLDCYTEASIYHVGYNNNSSEVHKVGTPSELRIVLDDLGYRASDLIQSNAVVWVEGPSDRIYIKKWLSIVDPSLIEGVHYSIVFYGGALISHLDAADAVRADEFVELLCVNRNCVVVIDRDAGSTEEVRDGTKMRILDRLGEERCWITKGREVENYLREDLITGLLSTRSNSTIAFNFGADDDLDQCIRGSSTSGRAIIAYDRNKPGYARLFAEKMTSEHLSVLDLKERIFQLDQIQKPSCAGSAHGRIDVRSIWRYCDGCVFVGVSAACFGGL